MAADGSPPPQQPQQQQQREFPAGFKFRPHDRELLAYVRRRVQGEQIAVNAFHEVDFYAHNPYRLLEEFEYEGERKAYLFSPRERKYPNGSRPRRSAMGGYWKASGKDCPIEDEEEKEVGTKRALSFFTGHQGKGLKTNLLAKEYRVSESHRPPNPSNGCTTLDEWVLYVLYVRGEKSEDSEDTNSDFEEDSATTLSPNDAFTRRNIASGKKILADQPSTSYGGHESLMDSENFVVGRHGALPSLVRSPTTGSYLQTASALGFISKLQEPFSSKPGSSRQPFQYDHRRHDVQLESTIGGCDHPFAIPLRAIAPERSKIDQGQLNCIIAGSFAQPLECDHQGHDLDSNTAVNSGLFYPPKPEEFNGLLPAQPLEYNHQAYNMELNTAVNDGMNFGMHLCSPNEGELDELLAAEPLQCIQQGHSMECNTIMNSGKNFRFSYLANLEIFDTPLPSQSFEYNHQGHNMESDSVNCGTNFGVQSYPPPNQEKFDNLLPAQSSEYNHQGHNMESNSSVSCGANLGLSCPPNQENFDDLLASQHLQYNDHQGHDPQSNVLNSGTNFRVSYPPNQENFDDLLAAAMQFDLPNQDPGFGEGSGNMNMEARNSRESGSSSAQQPPQYDEHQGYLGMQMDNGSYEPDFGGWCPFEYCSSNGMPSSSGSTTSKWLGVWVLFVILHISVHEECCMLFYSRWVSIF